MKLWRKIALLLVVFHLAAGGPGFAMPAHDELSAAMPAGCDDIGDAASTTTSDSGTSSDPARHGCCATDGCQCVAAHGVASVAALATAPTMPVERDAAWIASTSYASPALARLTRPPIG